MYDALPEATALARVQRLGSQAAAQKVSVASHTSLLAHVREAAEEHIVYQHVFLLSSPDDWQFYPSYFDSLFHLVDQSWSPPAEGEQ